MKKTNISIHPDGAIIRLHNKRITLYENPEKKKVSVKFQFADNNPDKPATSHNVIKGKVRESFICLSEEAMHLIVHAYIGYKRNKAKTEKDVRP